MYLRRVRSTYLLAANIFLFSVLCVRAAGPAAAVNARQQNDTGPFDNEALLKAMRKRPFNKAEWIEVLTKRGVGFRMGEIEERDIRLAGRYFEPRALDLLVKAVRDNYIYARINEPLALGLGRTSQLEHLGFKVTHLGNVGDDYLIKVEYPGADPLKLRTRDRCAHPLKWGNRAFTLSVAGSPPGRVTATLARDVTPDFPGGDGSGSAGPAWPPTRTVRLSSCVAVSMTLVRGNHLKPQGAAVAAYYISEPLRVDVLRHYAETKNRHLRTPIPPHARDTEPITLIYHQDAVGVARMLHAALPSPAQWANAYHAGVVRPASGAELAAGQNDGLSALQVDVSQSPAKIAAHVSPDPARGLLRVVCPAGLSVMLDKKSGEEVIPCEPKLKTVTK